MLLQRGWGRFLPYVAILILLYYVLPLVVRDTGSGMLVLLILAPAIVFVSACIFGLRRGFHLLVPVLAGLLFLPALWIYFNISAWVYAPAYALIALAGNGLGQIFYKQGQEVQ